MLVSQLPLLQHFYPNERTYDGHPVVWQDYEFKTLEELDRLRDELGSRCVLIRGSHGVGKETAIDAVFPDAEFSRVAMALFKSKLSKGAYQGGSIHLDSRMQANGLSRGWMGLKPAIQHVITGRGLGHLRTYNRDGWDYYTWDHKDSFRLLGELVHLNT